MNSQEQALGGPNTFGRVPCSLGWIQAELHTPLPWPDYRGKVARARGPIPNMYDSNAEGPSDAERRKVSWAAVCGCTPQH